MLIAGADRIVISREFQSLGPIMEKALSPKRILYEFDTIALYPSHKWRLLKG